MSSPTAGAGGRIHVAIFGSCVSRDVFEFVSKDRFTLQKYVARQSLISAYGSPAADVRGLTPDVFSSKFQRRMFEDDVRSSLPAELGSIARNSNLLLWDITDERLGVYEFEPGKYITRTVELVQSGLEDLVRAQARLIPFGSDEHFQLWRDEGLAPFVRDLERIDMLSRTRLIVAPWAVVDDGGNATPASFGVTASEANAHLAKYVSQVEGKVRTLVPEDSDPPASATHRWGAAPFHYADSVYLDLAAKIESLG